MEGTMPVAPVPRLALVLGGARSGKSRYAEAMLTRCQPPWCYIATAEARDAEMAERIVQHRARRGAGWITVEATVDLAEELMKVAARPVLVDCLTLWLTNLMLGEHDIAAHTTALEGALAARKAPTILVANEVGLGIVPENALARRFRDAAGLLNQRMAAQADHVVLMVAGLPLVVKGAA
jgi:adenosyl cobinamide kinase/adenosyl cobinamide phosphate guanylyltransferase